MRIDMDKFTILNEMYDEFFKTTAGGSVWGDYSLAAMLRYIKIQKHKTSLASADIKYEACCVSYDDSASFGENILNQSKNTSVTIIEGRDKYSLTGTETLPEGWRAVTEPPFKAANIASALTLMYKEGDQQKKQSAFVFANDVTEQVVIFTEAYLAEKLFNRIKACLWLFMPWYYPEIPTKEELSFFKLFDEDKDEDRIIHEIKTVADTIDARSSYYSAKLVEYENGILKSRAGELEKSIDSIYKNIQYYESEIAKDYASVGEMEAELAAFHLSDKHSEDLYKFFMDHKNIDIISISKTGISFEITDFIEFYDEDECREVFENSRSYAIAALGAEPDTVFKAVFLDKFAVPKVAARFQLSGLKRVSVIPQSLSSDKVVLPHPHLYRYGCLGANEKYISEYAKKGEWQLQIEQLIGAVKNINWGDSTVCTWMIRWFLQHKSVKCLYKDGVAYSYSEIKAMLKKLEGAKSKITESEGEQCTE